MNAKQIADAAGFLVAMRAPDAVLTDNLPDDLRPQDAGDVMAIQLETMRLIGPIGGWKTNPTGVPGGSPLPASGILPSPAVVAGRWRAIEAEIGFRFGRALPPRDRDYTLVEVIDGIQDCVATIEILEPRFLDEPSLDKAIQQADLGMHGGLIVGGAAESWTPSLFETLGVRLEIDGKTQCEARASNPGGTDLMRMLVWLANSDLARATGGVKAGAVVTTGSWTGLTIVPPSSVATAYFEGFPPVEVRFAG